MHRYLHLALSNQTRKPAWCTYIRGMIHEFHFPPVQAKTRTKKKVMGVLDIYGFEVFEVGQFLAWAMHTNN